MQFNERHKIIVENLMKIMRRSKLAEVEGVEMLAFSEAFYFLNDLNFHIENEVLIQQAEQFQLQQKQQLSSSIDVKPLSPFLEDTQDNPIPVIPEAENKKRKVGK